MADLLLADSITPEDRLLLAQLAMHPAFQVLRRIMEAKCQKATEAVIKLDPLTDNYRNKLASLQQTSRAINDFCSSVLRSIDFHIQYGMSEQAEPESEVLSQVQTMLDRIKNPKQQ